MQLVASSSDHVTYKLGCTKVAPQVESNYLCVCVCVQKHQVTVRVV